MLSKPHCHFYGQKFQLIPQLLQIKILGQNGLRDLYKSRKRSSMVRHLARFLPCAAVIIARIWAIVNKVVMKYDYQNGLEGCV